jgi:hypothetical protein
VHQRPAPGLGRQRGFAARTYGQGGGDHVHHRDREPRVADHAVIVDVPPRRVSGVAVQFYRTLFWLPTAGSGEDRSL